MNRWTLLKHEKLNDEMLEFHYDFLLENGKDCKTWKLLIWPELDGASVDIFDHSNHRLIWLTVERKQLTKNRGFVQRVDNGTFKLLEIDINRRNFSIILKGNFIKGLFKKNANSCQLISINQ
tara:strand:- start:50 stop:415 length:366 start_codon:yes stop_codon:yes gene_type:complete